MANGIWSSLASKRATQQAAATVTGDLAPTGRVYYVDNIKGSSTGTGLSWESAFDQLDTAITASEAWRLAQSDPYVRNTIYIKGTLIGYGAVAALPNYTDIIGVGACPFGNGAGIVRIQGSATNPTTNAASAADADAIAGNQRGNTWTNIQFDAAGSYWCADLTNCFRTEFRHCCFRNDAAAAAGCVRFTANSGGVVFDDCRFDGDSGYPVYGIYISNSITFNNCLVENCVISGTTAGVYIGTGGNDIGTVFRNNFIGDQGGGCAKAFDDNGPGYNVCCGNYLVGTASFERTARPQGLVGNHCIDGTTGSINTASS